MPQRHALVAGATGIVGRRVAELLAESGWHVTGLCRQAPQSGLEYDLVSVDLTDAQDTGRKLSGLRDITHVIYAARYDHPEGAAESVDVNAAMLRNVIDAVEPAAPGLEHVHLVHGTKYYGHMLGPRPVPLTEDTPRAPVSNFYFEHEDFIRERRRGKRWHYSTSRPHTFCDPDPSEPRNLALLIAVYAALLRERGLPFDFPGTQASYDVRTQFTYVPLLAKAIRWMATDGRCADQSYNITNGDSPKWSELWREFAQYFGLRAGAPTGLRLADFAAGNDSVWQSIVNRGQLQPTSLADVVLWPYADYVFRPEWDIISDTSKARGDGFGETVQSAQMFIRLFERFRRERIVP